MESEKAGGTRSIAKFLYSFLFGFEGIDVTPLKDFIGDDAEEESAAYEESGSYAFEASGAADVREEADFSENAEVPDTPDEF